MSNQSFQLSASVYDYLIKTSLRGDSILEDLVAETAQDSLSMMQIAPEQGQFMALLIKLMGARKAIEVGTYTGYSALCVARALGAQGELVACDISEEWTSIAQRYWQRAGVLDLIDLRLAPAVDTLRRLLDEGRASEFDFAFIDADKVNYPLYFEYCLELVRPGGLILVDNVLWSGAVADERNTEPDTVAIRAFNQALKNDERVEISMIPVADGLTLARKNLDKNSDKNSE